MRPVAAALAVLLREDQVLLVKRANPPDQGLWGFPGGKVEPGEGVKAAALRELHEETGLRATAGRVLDCVDVIGRDGQGTLTHHYLLVAIACHSESGRPRPGDDAQAARWVPLADVFSGRVATSAGVETLIKQALSAHFHERATTTHDELPLSFAPNCP